jgi:hypothetical protein
VSDCFDHQKRSNFGSDSKLLHEDSFETNFLPTGHTELTDPILIPESGMMPSPLATFLNSTEGSAGTPTTFTTEDPFPDTRSRSGADQGCQIFLGPNIPKREKFTK